MVAISTMQGVTEMTPYALLLGLAGWRRRAALDGRKHSTESKKTIKKQPNNNQLVGEYAREQQEDGWGCNHRKKSKIIDLNYENCHLWRDYCFLYLTRSLLFGHISFVISVKLSKLPTS